MEKNSKQNGRQKLQFSLIINIIIPVLLYTVLKYFHVNDFESLAWSAAIPMLDSIITWITQKRIDWIGIYTILGFILQLLVSGLLSGNTIIIKTNDLLTSGPLGVVFIVSALMNKPLLLPLRQAVLSSISTHKAERLLAKTPSQHQMVIGSIVIGSALLLHALVILIFAIILPTTTFLVFSKVVTWGAIIIGIGILNLSHRKISERTSHV
jgi:MFS family permease